MHDGERIDDLSQVEFKVESQDFNRVVVVKTIPITAVAKPFERDHFSFVCARSFISTNLVVKLVRTTSYPPRKSYLHRSVGTK